MAESNYLTTVGYMRPAVEYLHSLNIPVRSLIDIGANMGHFCQLAEDVFGTLDITTFEPNENCNPYLTRYKTYNIALGASEARLDLFKDPNDPTSGGNSLYKEDTQYFDNPIIEIVPITTLDSLNIQADLIKLDVQGAELDVLKGGEYTFRNAKALFIEMSFLEYNKHGSLIDDVLKKTREYGFRLIYTFGPYQGVHWYKSKPVQVDGLFIKSEFDVFKV